MPNHEISCYFSLNAVIGSFDLHHVAMTVNNDFRFENFESFLVIFHIRVLKYFQKSCNLSGYEKQF